MGRTRGESAIKTVLCPHCDGPITAGAKAMSMFCPNCRKRVILENFKIDTYHAVRQFATCGDVTVTKKGHVSAPVKVGSITIDGTLRGSVQARDKIEIGKTGKLTGDITARRLVVKDGGTLVGRCRVEPDGNGKQAS